jgi:hypothetical protein
MWLFSTVKELAGGLLSTKLYITVYVMAFPPTLASASK